MTDETGLQAVCMQQLDGLIRELNINPWKAFDYRHSSRIPLKHPHIKRCLLGHGEIEFINGPPFSAHGRKNCTWQEPETYTSYVLRGGYPTTWPAEVEQETVANPREMRTDGSNQVVKTLLLDKGAEAPERVFSDQLLHVKRVEHRSHMHLESNAYYDAKQEIIFAYVEANVRAHGRKRSDEQLCFNFDMQDGTLIVDNVKFTSPAYIGVSTVVDTETAMRIGLQYPDEIRPSEGSYDFRMTLEEREYHRMIPQRVDALAELRAMHQTLLNGAS
ncbi:MAG: hypothetical protein HY366_01840 [Candidatus Aenigmarchaeota archaeon]|nr:hypothetical protein [Candidatus Aenigmarchaeota archaeon]